MSETYPSNATLDALSGTVEAAQGVPFPTIGESPYYTSMYKTLNQLLLVGKLAGEFRVYQDGNLTIGVRPGQFMSGDTLRNYAGTTGQAVTDDATNYVYLTTGAVLTINTTGFPAPSATAHLPLATVVAASGAIASITDNRGRCTFGPVTATSSGSWQSEAETFFNNTDITGAEAQTLTGGANADALHLHGAAGLAASLNLTSHTITVSAPTTDNQVANKAYVDSIAGGATWQAPVLDRDLSAPPVSPSAGDRYVVKATGSGAWSGHDNDIAEYGGASWTFTDPVDGMSVYVADETVSVIWNGTAWVTSSAGGNLDNIADGSTYLRLAGVNASHLATASSYAADSVGKVAIAADVAGDGMAQAAGGELDVKVDTTTITINGSNQLAVITSGLTNLSVGVSAGIIPASGIVNAHIAASAAIAGSKLQELSVGVNAGVIPALGIGNEHIKAAAGIAGSKIQTLSVGANAGVIPQLGVSNVHCNANMGLVRSKLAAETDVWCVPLWLIRNQDGTALSGSASGSNFGISGGSYASPSFVLVGTDSASSVNYGFIEVPLPINYVAGGNVTVTIRAKYTASDMAETYDLDVTAYEMTNEGAVGSDLCATDPVENVTSGYADYAFTVTGTNLVPGDRLLVGIRTSCTATSGTIYETIGSIKVSYSVKG
jgi:hypothetical protein